LGIKIPLASKMLVNVDRRSMLHSREARAPFLRPELIECVLSMLSVVTDSDSNWFKGVFRQTLEENIPQRLPHGKKRGLSTPKAWKPIADGRSSLHSFKCCLDGRIARAAAWFRIRRLPKVYWTLLQVERALKLGQL
jgi:hypothetical protein